MATEDFKSSNDPASSEEEASVKSGYRAAQRERSAVAHRNDQNFEAKSRKVQITLRPSLYEEVKEKAKEECISFNEFVHLALERALEEDDL